MSLREEIIDAVIDGRLGADGIVTRQDVIGFFPEHEQNYTGVVLSNSEVNRDHSPTYKNFTIRVGRGEYKIHRQIIAERRLERGLD